VLRQVVLNAANTLTGQALVQIAAARGINTVAVMTQQPGFAMISGHLKSCGALCYIYTYIHRDIEMDIDIDIDIGIDVDVDRYIS
jgi:hypothetical protein